ncbi:Leuk-A4-hydro-C domain-containing protein [Aphelenchoides fujianensis]|nr:Leuk-A4-hydro-C domain-containing protein [Aphelenchoides fujianensis]
MVARKDPSSCSNVDKIVVEHVEIAWTVDFERKKLAGRCRLDVRVLKETDKLVLDVDQLEIRSIKLGGADLKSDVEPNGEVGQKLVVHLGSRLPADSKSSIEIAYETGTDGAKALCFMARELTDDKQHPLLYSQCQSIFARSILPCQDTPAVKQTYRAEVTVPKPLVCLMSGISVGSEEKDDRTTFRFEQPMRIPIYLLALVVGLLEKRDISDRCRIWSEPSFADTAAVDLANTDRILQIAEGLFGEYEWKRYDLLVLPSTFPFGGMENPCLTFLSKNIVAGDRSVEDVVAHEIGHSWTGNLVTNASWENFWLNEGFTTFLERKILGRLKGEQVRHLCSIVGWDLRLVPAVTEMFGPEHNLTRLIPDLRETNPEDAFSGVPYEKGSAFLFFLEQQLGAAERFDEFLRAYIKKFRYRSIHSEDFLAFLHEFFADKKDVLERIDVDAWLHKPGLPPCKPQWDDSLAVECAQLATRWLNDPVEKLGKEEDRKLYAGFTPEQKKHFCATVRTGAPLSIPHVQLLGEAYGLATTPNKWFFHEYVLIGLNARWEAIIPRAFEFARSSGQLLSNRRIFTKLLKWDRSREEAIAFFEQQKPLMHPILAADITKLIEKTR